jgi:hypothetical protein
METMNTINGSEIALLHEVHGSLCWGMEWTRMGNLWFEIGSPRLVTHGSMPCSLGNSNEELSFDRRAVSVSGEWTFQVLHASWSIRYRQSSLATTSSSLKQKRFALHCLDGQYIDSILLNQNRHVTVIGFDMGFSLHIRPWKGLSGDEDAWYMLGSDESVVSLSTGGRLTRPG